MQDREVAPGDLQQYGNLKIDLSNDTTMPMQNEEILQGFRLKWKPIGN